MKTFFGFFGALAILTFIVVGSLLWIDGCQKGDPEPKIIWDTFYISTFDENPEPAAVKPVRPEDDEPIIIYREGKDSLIRDTIYVTDTLYIYEDYLKKYAYSDTILSDSTAFIAIHDTIYQNKLFNRRSEIKVYNMTKIYPDTKGHFYLGGEYNFQVGEIKGFYQKNKHLFSIGASSDKKLTIGYAYRLK